MLGLYIAYISLVTPQFSSAILYRRYCCLVIISENVDCEDYIRPTYILLCFTEISLHIGNYIEHLNYRISHNQTAAGDHYHY